MKKKKNTQEDLEILSAHQRLSLSAIWPMLSEYYKTASIAAWDEIPFYPTSNAFIADNYAELILAMMRDYQAHLDSTEPLWVVELAAGSGCFSFYLLHALRKHLSYFESLNLPKIRYIMADFTEKTINSWQHNPQLKPFVDAGILDFALFAPDTHTEVRTVIQQSILKSGDLHHPLIVIANYFFDSLKHDAFRITTGQVEEVLHTFACKKQDIPKTGYPRFDALIKSESYRAIRLDKDLTYHPIITWLLEQYKKEHTRASVLMPTGAIECIEHMAHIAQPAGLVLLSSDKGFTSTHYLEGHYEQPFVAHHGVFSYSVNYDALEKMFQHMGGQGFLTSDQSLSVSSGFFFKLKHNTELIQTRATFAEKTDRQNLANHLYFLQDLFAHAKPDKSNELFRAALGYVKLSNYDPIAFCLCAPHLDAGIQTISEEQKAVLLSAMYQTRAHFYSPQQKFDVFYWLGRLYYGLSMYQEALIMFEDSVTYFKDNSGNLYFIAACYEVKSQWAQALNYYQRTQQLDPNCQLTQSGIDRVSKKLAQL